MKRVFVLGLLAGMTVNLMWGYNPNNPNYYTPKSQTYESGKIAKPKNVHMVNRKKFDRLIKKGKTGFIHLSHQFFAPPPPEKWKFYINISAKRGFFTDRTILLDPDNPNALYQLRPGRYLIESLQLGDKRKNYSIGYLDIEREIEIKENQIFYLGKIELERKTPEEGGMKPSVTQYGGSFDGKKNFSQRNGILKMMSLRKQADEVANGWDFLLVNNLEEDLRGLSAYIPGVKNMEYKNFLEKGGIDSISNQSLIALNLVDAVEYPSNHTRNIVTETPELEEKKISMAMISKQKKRYDNLPFFSLGTRYSQQSIQGVVLGGNLFFGHRVLFNLSAQWYYWANMTERGGEEMGLTMSFQMGKELFRDKIDNRVKLLLTGGGFIEPFVPQEQSEPSYVSYGPIANLNIHYYPIRKLGIGMSWDVRYDFHTAQIQSNLGFGVNFIFHSRRDPD